MSKEQPHPVATSFKTTLNMGKSETENLPVEVSFGTNEKGRSHICVSDLQRQMFMFQVHNLDGKFEIELIMTQASVSVDSLAQDSAVKITR